MISWQALWLLKNKMIGFYSESSKAYHYKSVSYTSCPVCLNGTYYIYEITPKEKEDRYFSLSCKKCSSEIFYSDISYILTNNKVIDEHQYRKYINTVFSYVCAMLLVIALGYAIYGYGSEYYKICNEYYKRYTGALAYYINRNPSLPSLAVDDFLVVQYPESDKNAYIMIKIIEIKSQHVFAQLSKYTYDNKQDLIDAIIYKDYGADESVISDEIYEIPKTELDTLFKNATLLRKKGEVL